MILTEAECAYFNDLKFMFEIDFKHNFYNIINDIVSCFYNHEDLKKTFSKFIHVINVENSVFFID